MAPPDWMPAMSSATAMPALVVPFDVQSQYDRAVLETAPDGFAFYRLPGGDFEPRAYVVAMYFPGVAFADACDCHLYDGWNDETRIHQYGCGETFECRAATIEDI